MKPRHDVGTIVTAALIAATLAAACGLSGCNIVGALGVPLQYMEEQKLIEVLPKYDGLEGKTVAIIVDTDLTTRYEHPTIVPTLTQYIAAKIAEKMPSVKLVQPRAIVQWQYRTPQWNTMAYGEMIEQLRVDRVVIVDLYEYRLNPPGNRYEWEGVAAANVLILERDSLDPDMPVESLEATVKYPTDTGLGPDSISAQQVETVLVNKFVQRVAWLFYTHEEPKYPDKYVPPPP